MKKITAFKLLLLSILFIGCKQSNNLPNGIWRATLKTESGVEIPFNFELSDTSGTKVIRIFNGKERIKVDEITISEDSILIRLPLFDSEIRAIKTNKGLSGKWIKHLTDKSVMMDFEAKPGLDWRFPDAKPNEKLTVSGRWTTVFIGSEGKDTTLAVGEFEQSGQKVTGTFLTTTGDYRFLEGSLSGDKLFLSTFDGSHAFLFTATVQKNGTISDGLFYSGLTSIEKWTAKKDDKAVLPDAYSLTTLKAGQKTIDFSFADLNDQKVSLSDNRFKNKVVVVQFLGSWCPNCMDETSFMAPFYEKYKSKGVEVVGLAYERTNDINRSKKNIEQLKKRFNVQYPLLVTGFTNKEVLNSMPSLNEFNAFPTTIIIDKKGLVRKIHTGFSGPGTGKHYESFVKDFEAQINALLNES